ncbi:hypothetical protein CC78DRAFT_450777, partial [Lojkania enalia]
GVEFTVVEPLPKAPYIVTEFDGAKGQGPRVIFHSHIDTSPIRSPENWGRAILMLRVIEGIGCIY